MAEYSTREERLKEITDKLEEGIGQLFQSGRYAEYLAVMAKFHNYSYGNILLIMTQCPSASQVAGYNDWKRKFGRQVKRFAKGIKILAPCSYKHQIEIPKIDKSTQKPVIGVDGKPEMQVQEVKKTYYKIVTVFDVQQTTGKPLPELASELNGEVAGFDKLLTTLIDISPMPVEFSELSGSTKGYCSYLEQRIMVKEGMSQTQTLKTLVHEICHAKCHNPETLAETDNKSRQTREVEAESVAYVVCQNLGIDTADYSFGYIAGWSANKELPELKASLAFIRSQAAEIIDSIKPPVKERAAPQLEQKRKKAEIGR